MPSTPPLSGSVRSAAVVNAEIRALWGDPRVQLVGADRDRYELLVTEWAAAVQDEISEAA